MLSTMTLRDGRTLEYAEFGDPTGAPVIFFHGTPATGGQAVVADDLAREHGVRLIAPTRPGYGDSAAGPLGLAATAADTVELADHLGLDRFALMGTSGGGPFSLAVAAAAPDRVTVVAVHASPGRYAEVKPEVIGEGDRKALDLAAEGRPDEAVRLMNEVADKDLDGLRGLDEEEFAAAMAAMEPPGESWLDRRPALKRAFRADFQRAVTTSEGMSRDNLAWLDAWDVDLAAVTAPVRLVYGEGDTMAEVAHAEWLQARLPSSELHVVPGGHGDAIFGSAADTFAAVTSSHELTRKYTESARTDAQITPSRRMPTRRQEDLRSTWDVGSTRRTPTPRTLSR